MGKGKYQEWITEEGLIKLEGWAKDGLTDEQIAYNIGINAATLYKWKSKYSEIDKSLKRGKEVVDRLVENAMFKEILGYEYTEETALQSGEIKQIRKYARPNPALTIFWLKNRKPKEWRDKQEIEQTGSVNITFVDDIDES